MYSHDYAKEISIKSDEKPVPAILGFIAVAIVGFTAWYGYHYVVTHAPVDPPAVVKTK